MTFRARSTVSAPLSQTQSTQRVDEPAPKCQGPPNPGDYPELLKAMIAVFRERHTGDMVPKIGQGAVSMFEMSLAYALTIVEGSAEIGEGPESVAEYLRRNPEYDPSQ